MESNLIVKNEKPAMTPVKESHKSQSKIRETTKSSENSNPNLSIPRSSPAKHMASPHTKPGISRTKSASKNQNSSLNPPVFSPRNKIRERKFVIAKKKKHQESVPAVDCKCGAKQKGNANKCLCVAYETLRASQEEFFKNKNEVEGNTDLDCAIEKECAEVFEDADDVYGLADQNPDVETGDSGLNSNSSTKRRREKMLEEARRSVPESGKVMHLVHAFEKLTCLPFSKPTQNREECQTEEGNSSSTIAATKPVKWELPGMRAEAETQQVSSSFHSSLRSSDLVLTAANLGLDPRASVSSSWDSSRSRVSSTTSNGGRRRRRNSLDSSGTTASRRWQKKQLKVTSQKPFTLRTEQRGRMKEEEFMKKLQEMMMEEEKMRVPIAQGLPWTTDEPECLIKPPVKEITRPIDLKLYSDLRAEERAEFDHQVAEKMSLIEQYKMERERQQKLAEEEEIRRLRKELVPKAQPMPYFDRPFIPRRSMKNPTIPREPKLHMPDHKKFKCCSSWSDTSSYLSQEH